MMSSTDSEPLVIETCEDMCYYMNRSANAQAFLYCLFNVGRECALERLTVSLAACSSEPSKQRICNVFVTLLGTTKPGWPIGRGDVLLSARFPHAD